MARIAIFVAASAAVTLLSRRPLRAPRSHGFFRFFAFEFLIGLVLWNAPSWFVEPFSARQIVSWCLLTVSLALAIEGFRLLSRLGKPARDAARDKNFGIENTTVLVTVSLYRFIRHPLYASLLAGAWGAFLKRPSAVGAGLALAASGFLVATAVVEERENLRAFGPAYAMYMKTTRRFVPFLF